MVAGVGGMGVGGENLVARIGYVASTLRKQTAPMFSSLSSFYSV